MAKRIEPRVLKGFRDFLPAQELERKRITHILESIFENFGFVPIDTPILEYTEVLLGKGGGETDKQVYRFTDHGGRDVAMRYDLTVPFARFMAANRSALYLPFKRYHISRVFRGENTQRGRYREFIQCDFDIVGTDSHSADFEILLLMRRSLLALGVERFTIRLSHRGIFNRFLAHIGVSDRSAEVLRTVDKLAKIGRDEVHAQLSEIAGPENAGRILEYITAEGGFGETLAKLERFAGGPGEDTQRLATLRNYMHELGVEGTYVLDPSITRGLDYYTGIVFETFLDELPAIGSVCSGGRYNDLASLYTKEEIPGVGASIGLDRLLAALEELGRKPERSSGTAIIVFCMDESLIAECHKAAEFFRNAGLSCEVYPEPKKLAQQFAFAEKKGIPLGVFIGQNEVASGTVTLKNLSTRESHDRITSAEAAVRAKEMLGTP